jgi:hypothetical protein
MAAASVDAAPTRFWCHECDREVRATAQGDGSFNCDACTSNFVELMEAGDPRGRPAVPSAPPAAAAASSANMGWQYSSSHDGSGGGGSMPFFQFHFGGAPGAHQQQHAMPPHQPHQHQQANMNPIAGYGMLAWVFLSIVSSLCVVFLFLSCIHLVISSPLLLL